MSAPEPGYPKPATDVLETITGIFQHQGQSEILELLKNTHAYFEEINYDNWNGGTYTWALRMEVPLPMFAALEPRLSQIEKKIASKLHYLRRLYPNDQIGEVTITPVAPRPSAPGLRVPPSEIELRRLWPDGRFRLFLSHVSSHKAAVSRLKDELALLGVAGFLAHEDIEPSLEWRAEIELGLRSMHALAAFFTSDFHTSDWTDQEIGWSLGRGILVVPVRLGIDPYGFAGKYQGVSGSLKQPAELASSMAKTLLANTQTHMEMRRSIVTAFSEANSFSMAIALRRLIVDVTDFTDEEKVTLRKACAENDQVGGAFGVAKAIDAAFGKSATSIPT